jgi:hypothetical protein
MRRVIPPLAYKIILFLPFAISQKIKGLNMFIIELIHTSQFELDGYGSYQSLVGYGWYEWLAMVGCIPHGGHVTSFN